MILTNTGSFMLFTPETPAESGWIDENVSHEGWMWLGKSLAVDARMADDLINGMTNDGIDIEASA